MNKDILHYKEIRCTGCNKKLAEGDYVLLSIKCPRCKVLNRFKKAL